MKNDEPVNESTIIQELYNIIIDRKNNPPEKSYVVSLMNGGIPKIAKKIREEAKELIEAAGKEDTAHTIYEAADLLFHYMVLLGYRDIDPKLVLNELARRFGTSGITEKESRNK